MPTSTRSPSAVLATAMDHYIGTALPSWLQRASPAQLNILRDNFRALRVTQEALHRATLNVLPIQTFAKQALAPLLPAGVPVEQLQWLEVRRDFGLESGSGWPYYRPRYARPPGLLRLMQNFTADDALLVGSGLVRVGSDEVLSADADDVARTCRQLDAGGRYQALLDKVMDASMAARFCAQKTAAFELALQIAALRGAIDGHEQLALRECMGSEPDGLRHGLRAYAGTLSLLGVTVADALLFHLRRADGKLSSVVLYLPSMPDVALCRFESLSALQAMLVQHLAGAPWRDQFSRLIGLKDRAAFQTLLVRRLSDPQPDLAVDAHTHAGNVFAAVVDDHLARIKSDARLLLVPTADSDRQASSARLDAWTSAGLGLLNLSGFFIPTIGALLLGHLVVQTLSEVFHGAVDWVHGHQHEALDHLLGVAETLAVTAVTAGGAHIVARGFMRSDFVDALVPVKLPQQGYRLLDTDLTPYAGRPDVLRLAENGLFEDGQRRWLRNAGRYYALAGGAEAGAAPYELLHPSRAGAWAPAVQRLGERGWRLRQAQPITWATAETLLDAVWPIAHAWPAAHASQVLEIAGVDVNVLRALAVEGSALPINLRETLRRFNIDQRVTRTFRAWAEGTALDDDPDIRDWCLARPEVAGLDGTALRQRLLDQADALRPQLFTFLCESPHEPDALRSLLSRDFPGLSTAYAHALAMLTDGPTRRLALATSRLPVSIAEQARDLLQLQRLNRAVEALYLANAESDEGAQLIFALMTRLPGWPAGLSITLHDSSRGAYRIAALGPAQGAVDVVNLTRRAGRYRAFDASGRELLGPSQSGPYSVLSALAQTLPTTVRQTLGLNSTASGEALAVLLRNQLPVSRRERLTLLGWTQRGHWLAPGTRLLDGRVGYALSGRGNNPDAWRPLLSRLRELFPALHADALEARLAQMMQTPANVLQRIADLEDDYTRMDNALQRWLSASLGGVTQTARRIAADRLRWAWRDQGDVSAELKTLTLSGLQLQSLPDFPITLSFPTINRLVISDTSLTVITTEFLQAFDAVEEVNLSGNRLLRLPSGLAYLVGVQRLHLARNMIRLDAQGWNAILGLPNLRELNLSDNPLTTIYFSFHQLPHLRVITLRRCRLSEWPYGLSLCGLLERADLRDNLIGGIPDEILQMPHVFRRAFLVARNRLSDMALRRLYALDPVIEHAPLHDPLPVPAPLASRAHWLPLAPSETRRAAEAVWDALQAQPNSQGLFSVLDWLRANVENSVASASLASRVWTLLWGMQADDALRERLFEIARTTPRDQNGVSECFSTLLRRQAVARAEREFAQLSTAQAFDLAQGLFRLDRLDVMIRVDLRERLDAGEPVDEVALALTYRVRLRGALRLPFQPQAMVPSASAEVSQSQLDEALQGVRDSEALEALVDSFSQRAFWQAHLRHRHPDAFAAMDVEHQARLAELDRRAATLASGALALERELLMAQRDTEQQGLVRQLTRELLFGRERGLG